MMTRQVLLSILSFGFCCAALAKTPTDSVIVVPSPQDEKVEIKEEKKSHELEKHDFIIDKTRPVAPAAPAYHLDPRPSLTLALSRAYDVRAQDNSGWLGVRVAPWMTATMRTEFGLDIHKDNGWISAALHSLPTRNLYRLYYGGGLDLIFDSRDELRPLMRLRNYYIFAAGGWELQLLENQNVRFEVSYHQGTQRGFAKASLGYTFLF